jgi:hypothetical protein
MGWVQMERVGQLGAGRERCIGFEATSVFLLLLLMEQYVDIEIDKSGTVHFRAVYYDFFWVEYFGVHLPCQCMHRYGRCTPYYITASFQTKVNHPINFLIMLPTPGHDEEVDLNG